jgi:uncharacterized protein (TIGR03435 family)
MKIVRWVLLSGALCGGQSLPSFEVASIRLQPWTNEGRVEVYVRGNTLYGEHVDLYQLVDFAYGLRRDNAQLSGGPEWARHGILSDVSGAESVLYHVEAKAPSGPPPRVEQFRLMLQALLADRFQLRVHHVQRNLPVYEVVVGKDGPKFRESAADAKPVLAMADGPPFRIHAVHQSLRWLIDSLGDPNHGGSRPVIDKTGLGGFYDFDIAWSPDDLASSADAGSPSIFNAVQRLGLKLEAATVPFDTIVIDHAERPTGN